MTEVYMPPERDGLFRLHVRVSWLNHVVGADIYVQPTTTQVDLTNVPQFQNMIMNEEQAREGLTVHMEGGGGENPQYSVDVVRRLAQHASWVHYYETEDRRAWTRPSTAKAPSASRGRVGACARRAATSTRTRTRWWTSKTLPRCAWCARSAAGAHTGCRIRRRTVSPPYFTPCNGARISRAMSHCSRCTTMASTSAPPPFPTRWTPLDTTLAAGRVVQ